MPRVPEFFTPSTDVASSEVGYQRIGADASMFGGQLANGLQSLGRALGTSVDHIAASMAADAERTADYARSSRFIDAQGNFNKWYEDTKRAETGPGIGFTKNVSDTFDQTFKPLTEGLQGKDAAEWNFRLNKAKEQWMVRAQGDYYSINDSFFKNDLAQKSKSMESGLLQNPTVPTRDGYVAQMSALIDKSGLPESEKVLLKQKTAEDYDHIYGAGVARSDPGKVIGALGGVTTFEKMVSQKESGGNPNIGKHPGSSAWGEFGITTETWERIANSDLGKQAGLSADPEARKDPTNNRVGFQILTQLNARELEKAGLPVNDRTLYLAHFAGPAGAAKLLRADPNQSAESVLPDAADSNPAVFNTTAGTASGDRTRPKTVGEVISALTSGFGGTGVVLKGSDPILSRLDPKTQMSLLGYAEREQAQQANTARAQANAQHAEWLNDFYTQLHDGRAGMVDIQNAREAGILTDIDEIQKAERYTLEKQQKITDLQAATDKLSLGATWNPASTEDHKLSEALYKELTSTSGMSPRQAGAMVASQTGVVPEGFGEYLRGAYISGDPRKIQEAGDISMRMMMEKPSIFYGMKGQKEVEDFAALYASAIDKGRPPEAAAAAVAESQKPDVKLNLGKTADIEAFRKNITQKDQSKVVADIFGSWYPGSNPKLPDAQMAAIQSDYKDYATEHFSKYHNEAAAEAFAKQQMKINYGVNSQGMLMKYPPENFFPQVGGKSDWIYQQAAGKIEAATGVKVTPDKVFLVPLSGLQDGISTALNVRSGKGPVYGLAYLDDKGVLNSVKRVDGGNLGWRPSPEEAFAKWRDTGGLVPVDSLQVFDGPTPKNPLKGFVPINPNAARPGGGF